MTIPEKKETLTSLDNGSSYAFLVITALITGVCAAIGLLKAGITPESTGFQDFLNNFFASL